MLNFRTDGFPLFGCETFANSFRCSVVKNWVSIDDVIRWSDFEFIFVKTEVKRLGSTRVGVIEKLFSDKDIIK